MTRRDKLYERIVNNPKDVNFEELDKLLKKNGVTRRQPSGGSSHYIYYHPELPPGDKLSIPKAKPIKAIYVKEAINLINKIQEER
ncbi:hypothetical protein Pmgp_03653 [Pelotomaculum propionicicum]|uniref:Toxin HicA n=1 Tax=Pelotomaculum propionicicum TaxID=258475 RepID=A0A4Y7RKB5_9FIRM|nr:hypothetical protein [Pelotomaculum propionicicum]TEB08757.1 hypothetical protein Pmgp_03653 [Pelotomaculum propionicicum]